MQQGRQEFREKTAELEPSRLVFLDEAGASTTMTRTHGCAAKGERVVDKVPQGHWHVTTMVGAIGLTGVVAGLVFEGATDTEAFATFVEQLLAPKLEPGQVVVMDNLSSHKSLRIRHAIEGRGAHVLFLPPYSPDLNPIEKMWAKVKSLLRSAAKRTVADLWDAIGAAFHQVTPSDCRGFFRSCGFAIAATAN